MIFFYYFIDFQKLKILFEIKEPIFQATVLKRPSQYCKTPYVADVIIGDDEEILGHSPSLGCCGLADNNASVIMTKVQNKKNPHKRWGARMLALVPLQYYQLPPATGVTGESLQN